MTTLHKSRVNWIEPRWPADPGSAYALPASADLALIAQFEARVQHLFAVLDAVIAVPPTPAAIETLRDALHKVAGTAAFFDRADLGRTAADLDDRLGDPGATTPAFLQAARVTLRRAGASA